MDKNNILIALSEPEYARLDSEGFRNLSVPHKVFSAIWALEAEVNNGGFSQYFFNSSGATAGFVHEALMIVGALKTADFAGARLPRRFPMGCPRTQRRSATRPPIFR